MANVSGPAHTQAVQRERLVACVIAAGFLSGCTAHRSHMQSSSSAALTPARTTAASSIPPPTGYPQLGQVVSISSGLSGSGPSGVPVVGKVADAYRFPEPAQQRIGTYPRVARQDGDLAISTIGGSTCRHVVERVTVTSPTTAIIVLGVPGYTPGQMCTSDLTATTSVVSVPGLDYPSSLTIQVNEGNLTSTATLPHT